MRSTGLLLLMVISPCVSWVVEDDCQCTYWDRQTKCICDECQCSVEGEMFLSVNISCKGTKLTCSKFPRVEFSNNSTIRELRINNCSLDDSLSCLLHKMRITNVVTVTLWNFLTPLRKEHVEGLVLLTDITVHYGRGIQTGIPYDAISALPNLNNFRLENGKVYFLPNSFQASKLNVLTLYRDSIEEVLPGSFQGLDQLDTLDLRNNSIKNLHNDSFQGLSKLRNLYLDMNMLSSIPVDVLGHMSLLEKFHMKDNPLTVVPNGLFQGSSHLREVMISAMRPLTLESRAFSNIPNLASLFIDKAYLKTLPHTVFKGSTALRDFTITNNEVEHLHPRLFRDQAELQKLKLRQNRIETLTEGVFKPLKKLLILDLSYNTIKVFPDGLFEGLTSLRILDASNNNLKHISENAFRGASILKLILSNNQLSFQNMNQSYGQHADLASSSSAYRDLLLDTEIPSYCDLEYLREMRKYTNISNSNIMMKCKSTLITIGKWCSPFTKLPKLRELDLKNNSLRNILDIWPYNKSIFDTRPKAKSWSHIDLAYNNIGDLSYAEMALLNDQSIDLSHNQITSIHIDELWVSQTGNMTLYGNPYNCDCKLHPFIKVANSSKIFIIGDSACSQPQRLRGLKLTKLDPTELACVDPNCMPNCDCTERPALNRLDIYCTSLDFKTENLSAFNNEMNIYLKLNKAPENFDNLKLTNVKEIDLSGLELTELRFKNVPESVSFLNLSHNKLGYLPSELLSRNMTFALSHNPLTCDCSHQEEINEIVKYRFKILDISSVLCSDGKFLNHKRLCVMWRAVAFGTGLAILGVVCITITVFVYKYSFELKIFISKHLPWLIHEEAYDASKVYDVFVSYAHQDEDFVRDQLMPKLENSPNYFKICIHSRDWLAGDTIPYNIAKSVEQSRRTVIILSENFLKSMWALLEFRAAHVQAITEGRARVIVVLLEDVSNSEHLDDEIKAYLKTNTYVKWGESWFWDKLVYALPKRGRVVNRREETRLQTRAHELVKRLDCQSNNKIKVENEELALMAL